MQHVFGEDDHVHERVTISGFGDEGEDVVEGVVEVGGGRDGEELRLAEAEDDGVGGLVQAAEAGAGHV